MAGAVTRTSRVPELLGLGQGGIGRRHSLGWEMKVCWAVVFAAWLGAGGAWADAGPGAALVRLVAGFYAPYLDTSGPEPPAALDVIAAHATPRLRALIATMYACEKREQGVCNLDSDVIIDGQDWDLKAPPVVQARVAGPDEMIVSSHFNNDGTNVEVDYQFVQLGGAWLINDVTDDDPENGISRLSAILAKEP